MEPFEFMVRLICEPEEGPVSITIEKMHRGYKPVKGETWLVGDEDASDYFEVDQVGHDPEADGSFLTWIEVECPSWHLVAAAYREGGWEVFDGDPELWLSWINNPDNQY